jgi:hypothetical protein
VSARERGDGAAWTGLEAGHAGFGEHHWLSC